MVEIDPNCIDQDISFGLESEDPLEESKEDILKFPLEVEERMPLQMRSWVYGVYKGEINLSEQNHTGEIRKYYEQFIESNSVQERVVAGYQLIYYMHETGALDDEQFKNVIHDYRERSTKGRGITNKGLTSFTVIGE